ncbi:MAG: SAM-dependent methyltransferase [Acidobacteriota bacterium]
MRTYVSRGGQKLEHALEQFELSVADMLCADFGCSKGGFTDCLLQHGARRVIAVDTGYGFLDYGLRMDSRVEVRERTNVLHAEPPAEAVDRVVMDLGWTRQRDSIAVARRWLAPGGRVVSLVKPQYEVTPEQKRLLRKGVLPVEVAEEVAERVQGEVRASGVEVLAFTRSPIQGRGSQKANGNVEFLALYAFPGAAP